MPMSNKHELEEARKVIDPEKYSRILRDVDLVDIIQKRLRSVLKGTLTDEKKSFQLSESMQVLERSDDQCVLECIFKLKAKSGRRIVAEVEAAYSVFFRLSEAVPREFFVLYNRFSLPMQLFPYFREEVHSRFAKMGLPTLVLPLRKFLVPDSKDTKKD
jgi:preprotein translocase subunit SecB